MRRLQTATILLLAFLVPALLPAAADAQGDPWASLDEVRASLAAAGPSRASFTQTYVPAGFSSGETESGTLALSLPDCLRWDYRKPYSKTFLLCGEVAHYWNAEDRAGRRYTIDRENEPGLDLLLLGVDELKTRYRATQKRAENGRVTIDLVPRKRLEAVASASLLVDTTAKRLVGISYQDREGNSTRFAISDYRRLDRDTTFDPPRHIRFQEQ